MHFLFFIFYLLIIVVVVVVGETIRTNSWVGFISLLPWPGGILQYRGM